MKNANPFTIVFVSVLIVGIILGGLFYYNNSKGYRVPGNNAQSSDYSASIGVNSGTPSQTNPVSNSATTTQTAKSYGVSINGFKFSPSSITISVGDSVEWTNADSASHTVTSDSGSELNSGTLSKGQSYSHTFSQKGTFAYHCAFHPGMTATVIVQ